MKNTEIQQQIDTTQNANRVKRERIKEILDNADIEESILHGKTLIVSYRIESGFTIRGEGSCVDPANFNLDIGRACARQDAENQLWRFEAYRLQWELYDKGVLI